MDKKKSRRDRCPICGGPSAVERRNHFFPLPQGEEGGVIFSKVPTIVCLADGCGEQILIPEAQGECDPRGRQPDRHISVPVYASRV